MILAHLDSRQRRLLMGAEAQAWGRDGIRVVARGLRGREGTVSARVDDLDRGEAPFGRVRRRGGGRKRATEVDPGLLPALLALVEPRERGDPMTSLRWTTKSVRTLAGELTAQGHRVVPDTVVSLLHAAGRFNLPGRFVDLERSLTAGASLLTFCCRHLPQQLPRLRTGEHRRHPLQPLGQLPRRKPSARSLVVGFGRRGVTDR